MASQFTGCLFLHVSLGSCLGAVVKLCHRKSLLESRTVTLGRLVCVRVCTHVCYTLKPVLICKQCLKACNVQMSRYIVLLTESVKEISSESHLQPEVQPFHVCTQGRRVRWSVTNLVPRLLGRKEDPNFL